MEKRKKFSETLQSLRRRSGLTQEQLAEKLYVSRTAVSKWETGGGYPGLDTLVDIAALFDVSVDELLSGAEIVDIAESESRERAAGMFGIVAGALDLAAGLLFVLPLFGVERAGMVQTVSLVEYCGITQFGYSFVCVVLPLVIAGAAEIAARLLAGNRLANGMLVVSAAIHVLAVLLLAAARQPYATALLFVLFVAKAAIALYTVRHLR